jgi:molybdopterin converting factor small subunit
MYHYVDRQREIEIPGTTLGEVLTELEARYPETKSMIREYDGRVARSMNIYIDDEDARALAGLDTPVSAESTIHMVPASGGG